MLKKIDSSSTQQEKLLLPLSLFVTNVICKLQCCLYYGLQVLPELKVQTSVVGYSNGDGLFLSSPTKFLANSDLEEKRM